MKIIETIKFGKKVIATKTKTGWTIRESGERRRFLSNKKLRSEGLYPIRNERDVRLALYIA